MIHTQTSKQDTSLNLESGMMGCTGADVKRALMRPGSMLLLGRSILESFEHFSKAIPLTHQGPGGPEGWRLILLARVFLSLAVQRV